MKKNRLRRLGTVLRKFSQAQIAALRRDGLVFGRAKNGKVRVDALIARLLHRHGK